jgi:ribonuclease PH
MVRTVLAAAILAAAPALAHAQSASAPLIVSATVVSACRVDVPQSAEAATFATMPIEVTCARGATVPHVQRPIGPRRIEIREALLIIDF